ncbi:MAG TPA: metallophosphoesterase [bacterium]|nr:metallophosphoesterase [bacterium]
MTLKLFHSADLHLSQTERAYSLAVLEELVYHCQRLQPDAWLLCGDVFDTHEDALALAADFLAYLRPLAGLPVLMIPGNHELSGGREPDSLAALQAAGAGGAADDPQGAAFRLCLRTPWELLRPEGLDAEFLAVPFQRSYGEYPEWHLPPKERRWRVGLLHGVVNGMTYAGQSDEAEHAFIEADLFTRCRLDYAALGHIHARGEQRPGGCLAHYPGSGRVWRRGEEGVRQATLAVLDDEGVHTEPVPIKEAGVYRVVHVPLDERAAPLGHESPEALVATLEQDAGPQDWLRLELSGFVERRVEVEALQRLLQRRCTERFRKLDVVLTDVVEAERLRGHPLVRSFDTQWRSRYADARAAGDTAEVALLERARRLALEQIHQRLAEY